MTCVTARMAKEWKALAGKMLVRQIAAEYGVSETTIYHHINHKHAERRREQWREYRRRRRQDPAFRAAEAAAARKYQNKERTRA